MNHKRGAGHSTKVGKLLNLIAEFRVNLAQAVTEWWEQMKNQRRGGNNDQIFKS
jgi:hypothetical protein